MAALMTETVSSWNGRPTIRTVHDSPPFLLCILDNAPLTTPRHLLDSETFSNRLTIPHAPVGLSTAMAGEDVLTRSPGRLH
jgi:hypothetical protein